MTKTEVREKLIELLAEHCDMRDKRCIGCEQGLPQSLECKRDRFGKISDHLIANGTTVQEWIPVTESLPENDVMVIGFTPCDGFMFIGYYHEEKKYDWKQWNIVTAMRSTKVMTKKVTHWMPLPKPPKTKGSVN